MSTSGAASRFFLGDSEDGFINIQGSWATISVKRKGWKGGPGSSILSIEVGTDLWQLSTKGCRRQTTCWESGFPSPAIDEWPKERAVLGFFTLLPEESHNDTLYLTSVSCSPVCHSWILFAGVLESLPSPSLSLDLTWNRSCPADFLVSAISVGIASIHGSQFLRVTYLLVLRFRVQNE